MFVPILKKGKSKNYDFVIQPRVKLQKGHPNWAWDIVGKIEDEYGFIDLHSGNWTTTEDKKSILIFDYGL